MTKTIEQTVSMLEMLPAQEQNFALEFVKRLVLAWDPDYTKLTPSERTKLEKAENGEYINAKDINWDDLKKKSEYDYWKMRRKFK